jgi:hypothetical protein
MSHSPKRPLLEQIGDAEAGRGEAEAGDRARDRPTLPIGIELHDHREKIGSDDREQERAAEDHPHIALRLFAFGAFVARVGHPFLREQNRRVPKPAEHEGRERRG